MTLQISPASTLIPLFERARSALAEATTVDEVKQVRDQTQALAAYLHQQRAGLEMQNNVAEIKIRAERRLGELLAETVQHKGGDANTLSHDGRALPDGVTFNQSSRWQTVARMPETDFERLIVERKQENNAELTSAFILRAARQLRGASPPRPFPPGVFDVILADPPWPYDNQIEDWGSTSLHYRDLDLSEITAMRPPAADNATLFLWTTNPFLEDAFKVVSAWGFEYKTNIVWVKTNRRRPGSGFYIRGHHELLFVCTRGSHVPDQKGKSPLSSVLEANVSEHSRKPIGAYELIEAMYPGAHRLELFARPPYRGRWEHWGDEQ